MHTQEDLTNRPPKVPTVQAVRQNPPPKSNKTALMIFLITVGVLGLCVFGFVALLVAVAIPNIEAINEAAIESNSRYNARNLSSIYASGWAAGLDFSNPQKDVNLTIEAIVEGKTVTEPGPFENSYFGMPGLSEVDQQAASKYLAYNSGILVYVSENDQDRQMQSFASHKNEPYAAQENFNPEEYKNESVDMLKELEAVIHKEEQKQVFTPNKNKNSEEFTQAEKRFLDSIERLDQFIQNEAKKGISK